MFKWFVWSSKLQKYIPISGLSATSRGSCAPVLVDMFGHSVGVCFSIPMFGEYKAVK